MKLSDHIALRGRSIDFTALGFYLPNPDPVLRARGGRIELYRELRTDAHVGGCVRRRKSAVKALEWGLDRGRARSRVAREVEAIFADLDLERLIGEAMDAVLYGYQPLEILWRKAGSLIVPAEVIGKPPEWFHFDAENALRFKTRDNPVHGEELPPMKFLLPRQDATYQNPYGFADLSMVFWPIVFKKGGVKFWLAFTEKFGSAFSVGKLPRSATPEERATLLDSLEALIQDGVATIPDDGSVELVEMAGKSASADLYEKLVMYCRSEVSIALTGTNQTTEANSNRASATAGLEVANDLRDGDAEIVAAALNQLIRWIVDINWAGAVAPRFDLWDQESRDRTQAARDKSNYDAGARFSNAYWMREYGYQDGDLAAEASVAPAAPDAAGPEKTPESVKQDPAEPPPEFAEPAPRKPADPLAADAGRLAAAARPEVDRMIDTVRGLVDDAADLPTLQAALLEAYGDLDSDELTRVMAAAFALAELKGVAAVRLETGAAAAFAEPAAPQPAPAIYLNVTAPITIPEGMVRVETTVQPAAAPEVRVENHLTLPDAPTPAINVAVQAPAAPAPVIHNAITVPETPVTLNLPPRKTETVVVRDGSGNIVRATQVESDLPPPQE